MNKIILTGRLTKDPERGKNESSAVRFRLAVNRTFKREGDPEADFFDVITFSKTADNVMQYLSKGRLVGVSGRVQWRSWQAQDGSTKRTLEVLADEVDFLEPKPKEQAAQPYAQQPSAPAPSNPAASMSAAAVDPTFSAAPPSQSFMPNVDFSGVPSFDFDPALPGNDPFAV